MDLSPSLLQIVPYLPPTISGVGDNATCLARELQARHGVRSRFVVGDPAWTPPPDGPAFPTEVVAARRAADLLRLLPPDDDPTPILLHYVPYGYAARGCPFWLVEALRHLRRLRRPRHKHRIITIFHELSADAEPIWKSAFWLAPIQRRLGRQIGRLSDVRRMTTTLVANQMRAMLRSDDDTVETVPVFSNLGEGNPPLPPAQRARRMVVFGTRTWREETYTRHRDTLLAACRRLEIDQILDVGAPLPSPPTDLPIPFSAHGLLRVEDAPTVFGESLAGFFTYPVAWLGKSSIFSAYLGWGLVPVTIPGNDAASLDGLRSGVHYLPGGEGNPLDEVFRASQAWYHQHRLRIHADGVYRAMTVTAEPSPGD